MYQWKSYKLLKQQINLNTTPTTIRVSSYKELKLTLPNGRTWKGFPAFSLCMSCTFVQSLYLSYFKPTSTEYSVSCYRRQNWNQVKCKNTYHDVDQTRNFNSRSLATWIGGGAIGIHCCLYFTLDYLQPNVHVTSPARGKFYGPPFRTRRRISTRTFIVSRSIPRYHSSSSSETHNPNGRW